MSDPLFPSGRPKPPPIDWPTNGPSKTSSSSSIPISPVQPLLSGEQTRLPVKQRVIFPNDRNNPLNGTQYPCKSMNNHNNNSNCNSNNPKNQRDSYQRPYDGNNNNNNNQDSVNDCEMSSQQFRNPSPPSSGDRNNNRWESDRGRRRHNYQYNRRNNNNNYNNNYGYNGNNYNGNNNNNNNGNWRSNRSFQRFNDDHNPSKRQRSDETDENSDAFYINWRDVDEPKTKETSTQTDQLVRDKVNQVDQSTQCDLISVNPKKTFKEAVEIDNWVKSMLANNETSNIQQINGQSTVIKIADETKVKCEHTVSKDDEPTISDRAIVNHDNMKNFHSNNTAISTPSTVKPPVFGRLGKPIDFDASKHDSGPCSTQIKHTNFIEGTKLPIESSNAIKTTTRPLVQQFQQVQQVQTHQLPLKTQLLPNPHLLPQFQNSQPPLGSAPAYQPQKAPTPPNLPWLLQFQKSPGQPGELNLKDPRLRRRLNNEPKTARPEIELHATETHTIPLEPIELGKKEQEKEQLVIDLS